MAHDKTTGRIWAEQGNGVSVWDVAHVLGIRSGDVATLCTHNNINPWARYRPIPCSQAANNKPQCITPAQRMAERYGVEPLVDMFSADDDAAFNSYANALADHGQYYLRLREWGGSHFKRLTDFVKDTSVGQASGKGYDHHARPDDVTVTISSGQAYEVGTHRLAPLIPEGQRILSIPAGSKNARFMFPVDHLWMDAYYQYVHGTRTGVEVDQNEEWLSPIDFMGTSTYSMSYASVVRRILIFTWNASTNRWEFYNYATDKTPVSSPVWNSTDRPFGDYPQAWLDLTDTAGKENTYYWNRNDDFHSMRTLTGRCLFVDCWLQSNSSVNLFPIVGYAYEVVINRTGASADIDIAGVLTFERVEVETGDSLVLRGYVSYDYITHADGISDEVKEVIDARFTTLTLTIGELTYDIKDRSYEHYVSNTGGEMARFEIFIPSTITTVPADATMQGTRAGAALNPKIIPAWTSG